MGTALLVLAGFFVLIFLMAVVGVFVSFKEAPRGPLERTKKLVVGLLVGPFVLVYLSIQMATLELFSLVPPLLYSPIVLIPAAFFWWRRGLSGAPPALRLLGTALCCLTFVAMGMVVYFISATG